MNGDITNTFLIRGKHVTDYRISLFRNVEVQIAMITTEVVEDVVDTTMETMDGKSLQHLL